MVFIFLATGFEEIEATTTIDIIRRAGIDVKIVSTTGEKTVTGAHNISLSADLLFEDADFSKAKMLILPGGLPGTTNLEKHEGLLSLIRKQNQAGKWIAAICAALASLVSATGNPVASLSIFANSTVRPFTQVRFTAASIFPV